MFAKRIDDAVKKEKIITERFFEPSRSAWPERALMLQTVKKKLSRKDSSSRIEVHGRPWHLCYKPLKKIVTERFFEPYRSAWPVRALMLQTVKKVVTEKFFEPSRSAWPERALMQQNR